MHWNSLNHNYTVVGHNLSECSNIQTKKSITFTWNYTTTIINIHLDPHRDCVFYYNHQMKTYQCAIIKLYQHIYVYIGRRKDYACYSLQTFLPSRYVAYAMKTKGESLDIQQFSSGCKCQDCHDTIFGLFAVFRWRRFIRQKKCRKSLQSFFETESFYLFPGFLDLIVHWLH